MLDALRGDLLGEWLPTALADLLCAWTGRTRETILESWGFHRPQAEVAAETDRALERLFGSPGTRTTDQP